MRRTKIVCTIGPASNRVDVLDRLVAAGMDVARLNFSHGTHAEHAVVIRAIREGEARWGRPITILQDLQGPKVRLGTFIGGQAMLTPGEHFTLTTRTVKGTASRSSLNHPEFLAALRPGDPVWMDDGMIQLVVEKVEDGEVECRIISGGPVSDHKGVSFPRLPVPVSCLAEKDREDLLFGIEQAVDYVAVSFVRSAADIQEVRKFLHDQGANIPIVAKLERAEIVANLQGLLPLVDAVMVARGDLGVEVPLEEVPVIQKDVIRQARLAKVPVIVATQMLESMVTHSRPTRAEVSDVATAIFDGADAIMLSAETATGRFPVETVEMMARIAERAERAVPTANGARQRPEAYGFPEAVAEAACQAARLLHAKAIVAFTQSGFSARLDLPGPAGSADHGAHPVLGGAAAPGALLGRLLAARAQGGDHRRDGRGGRGHAAGRRHRAEQRRDRDHLRRADVGDRDHQPAQAPSRRRPPLATPRERTMAYETLRYEVKDGIATITLNRPDAYNALNLALGRDLFHAALEADEDRAVRCVVITGAGKAFCAGGDVKDFADNPERIGILVKELTTYLHGAISRLARTMKPVVMAVNGIAAGGGMSLALSGDLVVAAESAKFTMAYSKIAASPDGSSSYFLPRLIGLRRALELHYTNRVLSAREAMDWGLVNRVHPDAEFPGAVAGLARELAHGPTQAFGRAKLLFHQSTQESLETQMELEAQAIAASGHTEDFRNGVVAFARKQPVTFTGR